MAGLFGVKAPHMPRVWRRDELDAWIVEYAFLWALHASGRRIKPLVRELQRSGARVVAALVKYLPESEQDYQMLKTALDRLMRKGAQDCVAAFLRYVMDHPQKAALRDELVRQLRLLRWE